MYRRSIAAVTAGFLASATVVAITATASTESSWLATATQALHLQGVSLGSAPADQKLEISVSLKLRNQAGLTRRIQQITEPNSKYYGKIMTPAQTHAAYSPTVATANAVRNYLSSQGFASINVSPDRLLVNGTATVAAVDRAFDTHVADFEVAGQKVYANTLGASVPRALGSSVSAVLGLSDYQMNLPLTKENPIKGLTSSSGKVDYTAGLTPMSLTKAYDARSLKAAKKSTVAIFMAGNPKPIIKNLRYAERRWHQKKVQVEVVYGENHLADATDNPEDGSPEWDLDSQMSSIVSGAKTLYMYDESTYDDPDVVRSIDQFVTGDKAIDMSISLGECDVIAFIDGAMISSDSMIAEGAVQGQSVFASSGDNGATCPVIISSGLPTGPPGISWPADGEFTTAVGGTFLHSSTQGKVSKETAWSGGGGGISPYETAAPWTLRANVYGQTGQENNFGGRGIPDVAASAEGEPGIIIFTGGKTPEAIEGTSVSAPLVNGLWTRIQATDHNHLGMATPNFYKLYNKVNPGIFTDPLGIGLGVYAPAVAPKPVPGFRDITSGTNYTYPAKAGWDYTTGIGALESNVLAKLLKHHKQPGHLTKQHSHKN